MKRFIAEACSLVTCGLLLVSLQGCQDSERTVGPTEHQQSTLLTMSEGDDRVIQEDSSILIIVPKTKEAKEIRDPWISGAILSILSEETRLHLVVRGAVYIEDPEIGGMIVAIAGMETFDV